jgi:hypothetical protein
LRRHALRFAGDQEESSLGNLFAVSVTSGDMAGVAQGFSLPHN